MAAILSYFELKPNRKYAILMSVDHIWSLIFMPYSTMADTGIYQVMNITVVFQQLMGNTGPTTGFRNKDCTDWRLGIDSRDYHLPDRCY